jgi:hypothetical protein
MSTHRFGGLLQKALVIALLLLGAVALSLFLIFHFITTTQIGVLTGMSLFVLVTVLLIAGYMLGIVALGFIAVYILPRILWQK